MVWVPPKHAQYGDVFYPPDTLWTGNAHREQRFDMSHFYFFKSVLSFLAQLIYTDRMRAGRAIELGPSHAFIIVSLGMTI